MALLFTEGGAAAISDYIGENPTLGRALSVVQTDAAGNIGNSGAPLVSVDGGRVGIVSWKIAAPGVGGRLLYGELPSTSRENRARAHATLAELEMLGAIYREGEVDSKELKRRVMEHCRTICDLAVKDPFPVRSILRQFERYLDFWQRDEWQDLAAEAVGALNQEEPQAMGVYLRPGKTDV